MVGCLCTLVSLGLVVLLLLMVLVVKPLEICLVSLELLAKASETYMPICLWYGKEVLTCVAIPRIGSIAWCLLGMLEELLSKVLNRGEDFMLPL